MAKQNMFKKGQVIQDLATIKCTEVLDKLRRQMM